MLSFADREGSGKTISRYEVQPALRCDKPNQSSGPIGWKVEPSTLSVIVVSYDRFSRAVNIGTFSTAQFSLADIHDNFEHKFPIIKINEELIDSKITKTTFDFNSKVVFILGGGIHLVDKSRPTLTFTHFVSLSPSPIVRSEHQVTFKALSEAVQNAPKETIQVASLKRSSDNGNLLDFSTSINTRSPDVNERTIKALVWLDDFRGVTLNANEDFPTASLFCLPTPEGICDILSTIGVQKTMEKNDPSATGSLADFFKVSLVVPQFTPAGTYGFSAFSDDRDQVGSRGFSVVTVLTEGDCKADEELINNRCIEQTKITCTFPEVRDSTTNTCVENPNTEQTCNEPLIGIYPDCKSPGTDGEVNGGEDELVCENEQKLINGVCTDVTTVVQTLDAYFQYTINLAGSQLTGSINQEGVFTLDPQAIIGLAPSGEPANLAEIRVTPLIDTSVLGTAVQIKSGTVQNTARADLLVNGALALQNFNIDYPQRTFGQISSGGLATFGVIGIQPAEIIDDAKKRLDSSGNSDPLIFLNNDKLVVQVTFSNKFEMIVSGQTFDGVIAPMIATFPFTFIQGIVTGGENEGCGANEIFSQSLQTCVPITNPCGTNQTLIGGHCVDNTNPNPDGSCNPGEVKLAGVCVPSAPSPTGQCTSPLVKNPDSSVGGCIIPSPNDNPKCNTSTASLFDPACLFPILDGTPSGSDPNVSGSCQVGESDADCLTRLQAAKTPIIGGGTLTIAIVGVFVLVVGVIIVAIIQNSKRRD